MTQREREALQRLVDAVVRQQKRPYLLPEDDSEQASEPNRGTDGRRDSTAPRSGES